MDRLNEYIDLMHDKDFTAETIAAIEGKLNKNERTVKHLVVELDTIAASLKKEPTASSKVELPIVKVQKLNCPKFSGLP